MRRWFLLVLIAGALAGGWQLRQMLGGPFGAGEDDAFEALLTAVAATGARPVEARLDRFPHAPAPRRFRGPASAVAPEIRIAVGRLEQSWTADPTARNTARLGVGLLSLNEWDRAIELLEVATETEPRSAAFQSDLAAAYLARASAADAAEDWARGLAAAARAIALDPAIPSARFNRALALEGLHLPLAAAAAWQDYPRLDGAGPWTDEAAQRALTLRPPAQPPTPLDDAEVNTQPLREEIEDRLLPQWGEALLKGRDALAAQTLDRAETRAGELAKLGGDTMAADAIALIRRLERADASRQLPLLARGHVLFGQARSAFRLDNLERAAEVMATAGEMFRGGGSHYAWWAPIYRAIPLRFQFKADEALSLLRTVPVNRLPATYHNIRGRLLWTEGVMRGALRRPDLQREPMTRAIEAFTRARERDHQIMTTTLLAETEWFLGEQPRAWSSLRAALALIGNRDWTNRYYPFFMGAFIASGVGLPEVALEFLTARLRLKETAQSRGEVLLQRARLRTSLGDLKAAAQDLDLAVEAFAGLDDTVMREFKSLDVAIARAELYSGTDCGAAIGHADRAYRGLATAPHTLRIVAALAVRAKCRQALGDFDGARNDLAEASRAFECRRRDLGSDIDRVRAFEQERSAFKALVRLEVLSMKDEWAGLRTAERARAGVLTETWRSDADVSRSPCDAVAQTGGSVAADAAPVPPGVAVIYYESLDDRVLTWVLTHDSRTMLTASVPAAELRRMVSAIHRAIRRGADLAALKPHSTPLFETLIAPALDEVGRAASAVKQPAPTRIVFVPDGPLFAVPFGALPDANGQPLIRHRAIGVAPSLATFLAASQRLSTFEPADVLAIGDGHDARASGLPRLPGADAEAEAVGRLYPRRVVLKGPTAIKQTVLGARHAVVHFAGHTVVNPHDPRYSQMLLAPDPATGDAGRLFGAEITRATFGRTSVVVLATCDGAAGPLVEGEGAISVARTFFAAGVPAVVASLWPVADDIPDFAQTLHAQVIAHRDVTQALRVAQLAVLDARPRAPVSLWGGFIMFGGQSPVQ